MTENASQRTRDSDIDRMLINLDVKLEAIALCVIGADCTLVFEPNERIVVHHVISGAGTLEVANCLPMPFGPDSMLLIPANRAKKISARGNRSLIIDAEDHCSTIPGKLMRLDGTGGASADLVIICGGLQLKLGSFGPFANLSLPIVEDMSPIGAVRIAFQTMLAEQNQPTLATNALTAALMKQCLLLFIRQHLAIGRPSSLSLMLQDEKLARAVAVILDRPRELRMRDLAAAAGMSRSAFAKRFVEAMHMTPMAFARQSRLQRAAELLESTDLPIKTIASDAGYASRSQFCRAFRAELHVDPGGYRDERRPRPTVTTARRTDVELDSEKNTGHPSI